MAQKINSDIFAPINNVCLMILAAAASTFVLIYTKTFLMPFIIAVFISMVAGTAAQWMKQRWKLPYGVGLAFSFLLFLGLVVLAGIFISNSIETFVSGADIYSERLNDTIDWILFKAQEYGVNINAQFMADTISKIPVFNMVKSVGSTLVSIFTNLMLITLFVIFIFMGKASEEKTTFVGTMQKQISFYLLVKIGVSLLAAITTWIVLASIKTELATMLAVLAFVLNFIPNVGPLISTLLPMPVLFLQYGFDWHILLALILLTALHFVIGNILETKWLGRGMDLDPIVVIASLIFWALVWGPMGALLAVPLTSIIKMILERSQPTRPFADLLGGKMPFK